MNNCELYYDKLQEEIRTIVISELESPVGAILPHLHLWIVSRALEKPLPI